MNQLRLRWLWVTWPRLTMWLCIGGRKPLAHLTPTQRRLRHLPAVRWRLWPRPWNFNGPVAGYKAEYRRARAQRDALYQLSQETARELRRLARDHEARSETLLDTRAE